ncbi:MAG: AI-2E family transporter [Planctomycetes bacterium]|nr:AI-2E family transporter [Planctomycetota bacterium]
MTSEENNEKTLPPPWDRIFSLATRTFVWALLIAVLYILRPFLLLVFLTFVFAYIQAHGVEGLAHRIKDRTLRVVIVGLVFLGTLFATGFTLLPQVQTQAKTFLQNREIYIADADKQLNAFLSDYPSIYESLAKQKKALQEAGAQIGGDRPARVGESRPVKEPDQAAQAKPGETVDPPPTTGAPDGVKPAEGPDSASGRQDPETDAKVDPEEQQKELPNLHLIRDLVDNVGKSLAENPLEIGQSVLTFASSFLLSLLFSFLIVLDLRKITRGVKGLANTKIGFIYDEVADNIAGFGRVLGRALEAQLFIAVCNTILTAVCIWLMGIPNLLVLSTIVFFCSFIPVVGTFISSTPIALLALQGGGVSAMLLVIVLIVVVHLVETYVLNPQIYGHHMHMNPVLVLIVLTIGGKLFGIWGLILGIPIVNYVFRHAIRHRAERPAET